MRHQGKDKGKIQDQNTKVDVEYTLLTQNGMGVGDTHMERHVKDYRGKGKEDDHMDRNLDVHNEDVDIEKVDIEKQVGIDGELNKGMHMDCGMDTMAKNRNCP